MFNSDRSFAVAFSCEEAISMKRMTLTLAVTLFTLSATMAFADEAST